MFNVQQAYSIEWIDKSSKGDSKLTTYQPWQDIPWACTLELCAHLPTKKQILELACGYYLENIFFRTNN